LLLLSLRNFLKNTIITIEEKTNFFKKRLKDIRIYIYKLIIIIYIINIIVGSSVSAGFKVLGSDITIISNIFNLILFWYFLCDTWLL